MHRHNSVLLGLSLCIGAISFSWANYSAVLPVVIDDLAFSGTEAGIVYSAYFLGYLVAILPAGYVADRGGIRRLIGTTAIGTGIAGIGFAFLTTDVLTGSLFRFLAGACFAGVYVPGIRLLADWFDPSTRGKAIGIYVGILSIGSGAAYPITSWIATTADWRVALAITSGLSIPAGIAVFLFTADHPSSRGRSASFSLSVFTNRTYLAVTTAYAGHNWELFAVQNWIVVFLVSTPALVATGEPTVIAGLLGGILVACGGPGNILGGWLSDRIGRLHTSGGFLALSGVITIALGILTWQSVAVLGILVFVYGTALAADSTPLSTMMTELAPDEEMGTALAWQSLLGFIPGLLSPVLFGFALDVSGFMAAFGTLAAGVLVGLAALWVLRRSVSPTSTAIPS